MSLLSGRAHLCVKICGRRVESDSVLGSLHDRVKIGCVPRAAMFSELWVLQVAHLLVAGRHDLWVLAQLLEEGSSPALHLTQKEKVGQASFLIFVQPARVEPLNSFSTEAARVARFFVVIDWLRAACAVAVCAKIRLDERVAAWCARGGLHGAMPHGRSHSPWLRQRLDRP